MGLTVLLVSRQPEVRRQLRVMLNRHAGRLIECPRAAEAAELLLSERVELILLDLSGDASTTQEATDFIRAHRERPLIALVAANDEQQRMAALRAGADEYTALPCGWNEMLARIRTVLDRPQPAAARTQFDAFHAGALEVDLLVRAVRIDGKSIHLTPTEYKLLRVLVESAGKVVTYERLLREVWGQAAMQSMRRLRVHMKQLQRKFEFGPSLAFYLIAEPAIGYRLWVPA